MYTPIAHVVSIAIAAAVAIAIASATDHPRFQRLLLRSLTSVGPGTVRRESQYEE